MTAPSFPLHDSAPASTVTDGWDLADEGSARLFNMKYLRHKTLGFILFEPSVRHDDVAATLGGKDQIVSAGFVFAPAADLKCLGHSSSLQLAAAPNDEHDLRTRMIVV